MAMQSDNDADDKFIPMKKRVPAGKSKTGGKKVGRGGGKVQGSALGARPGPYGARKAGGLA